VTVQRQIVELLARLQQRRKMSMLFISHDLGLVGEISDRVVVMRHGVVREAGPVATIFTAPQDSLHPGPVGLPAALDTRPRRLP
jgi:peptide/nickel transport system ATP-binding protein